MIHSVLCAVLLAGTVPTAFAAAESPAEITEPTYYPVEVHGVAVTGADTGAEAAKPASATAVVQPVSDPGLAGEARPGTPPELELQTGDVIQTDQAAPVCGNDHQC